MGLLATADYFLPLWVLFKLASSNVNDLSFTLAHSEFAKIFFNLKTCFKKKKVCFYPLPFSPSVLVISTSDVKGVPGSFTERNSEL